MPDDSLFGDQSGDPKEGGVDDKSKAGAVDLEALSKSVSKTVMGDLETTLSPVMGEIGKVVGALNTKVTSLEEANAGKGGGSEGGELGKDIEELLANPDKKIADIVAKAKEKDSPLMNAVVRDRVESHIKAARMAFDAEYGDGAYDEHVAEKVEGILKNYPREYLVMADGVDSALTQIKGQNIGLLMELKEKAEASKKNDFTSVGKGRVGPDPKKGLEAEEKKLLAKMVEHGQEGVSEKVYEDMKNIPPTLEAYLAYKKESTNAG